MAVILKSTTIQPFALTERSAGTNQLSYEIAVDSFSSASLLVDVTAVNGSPTSWSLNVKLQYSPDTSGDRWFDLPNGSITTLSTIGQATVTSVSLQTARRLRVSYSLLISGGSSPTVTFAVNLTLRQQSNLPLTATGALQTTLIDKIAGEDLTNDVLKTEHRFAYANVTATTATTIKSGAGFVHTITVNNPSALASATTASTIAIYDNTSASGTLLGTITLPPSANLTTALPFTILLDVSFTVGLTTVIALGTSGSWTPNLTVSFR